MIRGCDLSAVQGVLPDAVWEQLVEGGVRFAFLRTVVGNETWVDNCAAENAKRAKAHGLLVGPYTFPYPLPHLNPREQAEYFVRRLEALGMLNCSLPPMCDAEWPAREEWKVIDGTKTLTYPWRDKWHCSDEQIREWLIEHLERCDELTDAEWMLYSFRYWIVDCVQAWRSPELTRRKLVLADYTLSGRWPSDEELARISPPKGWGSIAFVQHDGNGGLLLPNGGDADFQCFLGTEEELRALAKPTSPDAPIIDLEGARLREMSGIVDAAIADYRRTRIIE